MSKQRLNELLAHRELLENEADMIAQQLKSPGPNGEPPAGLKDPLVDSEGFPRGDIDLFEVRAKRNRLAIINTDYRALMKEIETEAAMIHSSLANVEVDNRPSDAGREQGQSGRAASIQDSSVASAHESTPESSKQVILIPIARIDEILPESPSAAAGLVDGDELLSLGTIDYRVTNPMSVIPKFVYENANTSIPVVIRRGGDVKELTLTPRQWSGRGLLGCHLTPV